MPTHTKRYPWTPCENENTEFKEKWCESARTTLIAFANTFGGRIYESGVVGVGSEPGKVNVNRFTGEGGRLEESREFEGSILRQRTDALSYQRELNRPVMQKTREQRGRRVTGCVRVPENHPAFL